MYRLKLSGYKLSMWQDPGFKLMARPGAKYLVLCCIVEIIVEIILMQIILLVHILGTL